MAVQMEPGRVKSTIVRVLDEFNAEMDIELERIKELANTEGTGYACRSGCAACCTYVVDVGLAEALRIAYWINGRPSKDRMRLVDRMLAWTRDWIGFCEPRGRDYRADTPAAVAAHWNAQRKACPFLDMDTHACTIYSVRPTACRLHHACNPPTQEHWDAGEVRVAPGTDRYMVQGPGEGCFTTQADADAGHCATIWQVSSQAVMWGGAKLVERLINEGIELTSGNLVPAVLLMGQAHCKWSFAGTDKADVPVPVLASSFPTGEHHGR